MITADEVRTGMTASDEFKTALLDALYKVESEILDASKKHKLSCSYVIGASTDMNILVAEQICEFLVALGYHAAWRSSTWVPGSPIRVRAAGEPPKVFIWIDWRNTIAEIQKKVHVGYVGKVTP